MPKNEAQRLWSDCLSLIQEKISPQGFRTWFSPIVPESYKKGVLTIQVPSQFFYEWLESEYAPILREVIQEVLGKKGRLNYQVVENEQALSQALPKKNAPKKLAPPKQKIRLNPLYTFDNFVVWDGNELTQAALVAISQKPGKTAFNPLMIHSSFGLGKTHALQATIHALKAHNPQSKFFYTTAEDFTAEFINSIRNQTIQKLTELYTTLDILIIDDIQFFAGKTKTQEIFFNIFNHLYQNGAQIILSSDRPPSDLEGFPRRLLSRFKCGLTTEIKKPDLETRIAIIQNKLEQNHLNLPAPLISRIAQTITSSIRELEGVINSLAAHASLKKNVDTALVDQVLHGIAEESEEPSFNIKYLQKQVAEHYDISLDDLISKKRNREIATARHVAMYLARFFMPEATLQTIGLSFGRRDHSTVSYGIKTIEDLSSSDRQLRKALTQIKKNIQRQIIAAQP